MVADGASRFGIGINSALAIMKEAAQKYGSSYNFEVGV